MKTKESLLVFIRYPFLGACMVYTFFLFVVVPLTNKPLEEPTYIKFLYVILAPTFVSWWILKWLKSKYLIVAEDSSRRIFMVSHGKAIETSKQHLWKNKQAEYFYFDGAGLCAGGTMCCLYDIIYGNKCVNIVIPCDVSVYFKTADDGFSFQDVFDDFQQFANENKIVEIVSVVGRLMDYEMEGSREFIIQSIRKYYNGNESYQVLLGKLSKVVTVPYALMIMTSIKRVEIVIKKPIESVKIEYSK